MTNINLGNTIPRNGLVGEWLLDGNALDTSGNVLTGTNSNGVYVKSYRGYVNQGWQGNGSNARIQASDNVVFPSGGDFAINVWVKPTALPTSGNIVSIISKYDGSPNAGGYDIMMYNNAGTYLLQGLFNNSAGAGQVTGLNHTLTIGSWCMLTYILSGTTGYLYKNGILLTSSTVSGTPADNTKLFNIGNFGYYTPSAGELGRYFNGMVNLTRIYNRALNTNEIQLLYLEGLKKLGPANLGGFPNLLSNLVYYADFKGTAHNLVDGVNGTVSGATLTTDRFGYTNSAYSFSGGSNRIAVTGINSGIGGSFTYSFWYKPSSVTSAQLFLYDWGGSSRNIYFEFTAGGVMNFFRGNGASSQDTALSYNPGFSVGTYYHITITQSGTAKAMYVNGVSVATQTSTLSGGTTANTVYISSSNGVDTGVQGVIDESILMNKALSASEVSTLYKLTSSDYIYPNPSYDLLSLREGLVLDLNEQGKDLSGNGYNGTITGSPVILRQGKAKGLNHTTSTYINFGNILNYEWNQPFTKTFWHKFTDAGAYKQLIGKQNNSAPNQGSWIEVNGGKYGCWLYYTTPNSNVKETTTTYNDGIMRMVTFTRDGSGLASGMKLYINGNIDNSFVSKSPYVGPATGGSLLTTQGLQINGRWNSTDSTHTGTIVNPRIRNRALTAREVQALYYSQKGNYIY